jgi:eukaryotic-like serine/threonine-protein kinase
VRGPDATKPGAEAPCARCGARHRPDDPCDGARTLPFGTSTPPPPPAPDPGADPLVGSQVGSFRIVRLLGRGGMGTVYLAEHPGIGSRVAVKFLHESMASDPAVVARFYDEARAVNLVGHENIVGIYDLSVVPPGRYYFVMEYLEGATLQALLRAGKVPPDAARDVLLQACDALQCAHDRGVVHRDMKPDNVFLVRRRGREHFVKLLDFGIAKLRDGRPGSTAAGCVVGTPEYMAPEQCEDGPVDARTDVYAVGVMAFELVTGRLPFDGRNVTQLLLAHLREQPPRPSALAPVDPVLERAILRALEKDPAARFQSMDELAAALAAAPFERARRAAPAHAIAPTATLTPVPAAAPAATRAPSPLAALSAEVRAPGAAPARLAVAELTRGGLFLRADAALPPLLSRVTVVLAHPSLKGKLELGAEVVRHVSAADAGAWRMPPGFAVQFDSPPPEARAALAALADEARGEAPPSAPPRASAPEASERLAQLEARRAAADPYAMLGVAPDAEFAEVRRAIRALRDELEELRARPIAPDHPARATALLASVEAAQDAVGSPAVRLAHDARSGNHRGVDRCLCAGVPAPLVEARRRELLAAEPARAVEAERHLARAEVARKLGNATAAAAAYEAALSADPLDRRARDAYAAFRRSCTVP